MFAKDNTSKQMDFDDFLEMYYLVHSELYTKKVKPKPVTTRKAMLYWHFVKEHEPEPPKDAEPEDLPDKDVFNSNLMKDVGRRYFGLTDEQVLEFLDINGIKANSPVTVKAFIKLYENRSVPVDHEDRFRVVMLYR